MHSILMEGVLHHLTNPNRKVQWSFYPEGDVHMVKFIMPNEAEQTVTIEDPSPWWHLTKVLCEFCAREGYSMRIPDYGVTQKIPWRVAQHLGNEFAIVYTINGDELRTKLTIPGADVKITEELVRVTIDRMVTEAARKRRFTGLSGDITLYEEEKENGTSSEDTAERPV